MSSTVLQEIQIRCMKLSGLKKKQQTPEQYACSFHQLLRTRQEHYTRKYSLFFTRKQDKKVTTYSACLSVRCFPVWFVFSIFKQPMSSTKGQQMSLDKTLYFYQCWMSEFICQLKIKIWFCNSLSIFVFPMSIKVIYL